MGIGRSDCTMVAPSSRARQSHRGSGDWVPRQRPASVIRLMVVNYYSPRTTGDPVPREAM